MSKDTNMKNYEKMSMRVWCYNIWKIFNYYLIIKKKQNKINKKYADYINVVLGK